MRQSFHAVQWRSESEFKSLQVRQFIFNDFRPYPLVCFELKLQPGLHGTKQTLICGVRANRDFRTPE